MGRQIKVPDLSVFAKADSVPQYVNDGNWISRADLKAQFPAGASNVGRLARVLDVWGSVRTTLICEYDGTFYYWRPQRTDYAIPSVQTSGKMNLVPLVTAPRIFMKNTLLGNVDLALSTDDVWPGCTFDITAPSNLGLFSASFSGLIGGVTSLLTAGQRKVAVYTSDGWRISA